MAGKSKHAQRSRRSTSLNNKAYHFNRCNRNTYSTAMLKYNNETFGHRIVTALKRAAGKEA